MKAYELIEKPEAWGQGRMKRPKLVPGSVHVITRFCAVGAIREKYGLNEDQDDDTLDTHKEYCADIAKLVTVVSSDAGRTYTNEHRIEGWNDFMGRTHDEVLDAMRRADV